ncbi:Major facilitator superfamily transporter [Candidatus Promineifilum breve]|uniref:Major facilitator superfamily transporter n=1 Tax=Candidatus Promineifilum breve TaxID=1806508 RepID=A0A160T6V6_9CHLR|nr:MFS transporter [Candidatus Promineifilum breve]CUS05662.1 Major facilitator superfamily transporter [Candidatus Promineifilum breve]
MKRLPPNIWLMTAASFLTDVSSDMVNNLVPLFLANVLGAGTATIGLVEGIAESTGSFIKLLSGWWSDRVVSRKPPTVIGYGVSALSKPLLALAGSWSGVLAVRFADRLGKGIRTAPRDALLADSAPAETRGLAFGVHRAGDSLGAVVGLALALVIVRLAQGDALTLSAATFRRIALASAVPGLLAVLTLMVGLREVRRAAPAANRPLLGSFRAMPAAYRRYLLIVGLFTLGNSADAFIILRAQERGLSVVGILAMLLAFNLVYSLVAGPAGALSDKVGRPRLILAGWAVYALIYLGLALAGAGWQIVALFIVYGLYHGLVEGNARAYVADLAGAEARGAAYGLYHAVVGLLTLPASLIAGLLWQGVGGWAGFGPSAPFWFGAGLAGLAAGLLAAETRRGRAEAG